MKKTGAVIVAAGLSSRMKKFKPMLPFGDSTISLHIVSMLKKLGADPIVVVTGYRSEELEEHLSHAGVRFVKNERFRETQMFDSVKLGIRAVAKDCERIMIMPADIPAIMPETFRQLMMIDAPIIRTMHRGKTGHPVVIRTELAEEMLTFKGDGGLKGAMEASGIPITNLEVEDEGVCKDVDTREEYEALLEWNYKRGQGHPIQPLVQVRLKAGEVFFGPGSARLLEMIDKNGSIQEACAEMELSYSKGSRMVKIVEKQMGFPVVERHTGGFGGGGSHLTEVGKRLLEQYRAMTEEMEREAETVFWKYFEKGLQR